jgi:hypothetical protein
MVVALLLDQNRCQLNIAPREPSHPLISIPSSQTPSHKHLSLPIGSSLYCPLNLPLCFRSRGPACRVPHRNRTVTAARPLLLSRFPSPTPRLHALSYAQASCNLFFDLNTRRIVPVSLVRNPPSTVGGQPCFLSCIPPPFSPPHKPHVLYQSNSALQQLAAAPVATVAVEVKCKPQSNGVYCEAALDHRPTGLSKSGCFWEIEDRRRAPPA